MPLPKLSVGSSSAVSWEPTVVYMLLFVIAEMIIFGLISRMLR